MSKTTPTAQCHLEGYRFGDFVNMFGRTSTKAPRVKTIELKPKPKSSEWDAHSFENEKPFVIPLLLLDRLGHSKPQTHSPRHHQHDRTNQSSCLWQHHRTQQVFMPEALASEAVARHAARQNVHRTRSLSARGRPIQRIRHPTDQSHPNTLSSMSAETPRRRSLGLTASNARMSAPG